MSLYERHVLPHLLHLACGTRPIMKQREKVVPAATGRVLEVGMGSGINLSMYNPDQVEFVWGLEPSEGMRRRAQPNLARSPVEVRWLDLPGEEIPLEDDSVDTIMLTYTLCTIPDWRAALAQMRRVLRPGGRMLFCEHGEAPDRSVKRWQERINPIWKAIAGGCHLHRPIPRYIDEGGFRIENLDTMYVPGPRVASFNYWGQAKVR
ncbi:MAG: class I SAM-dependent methyltransferase [Pseudomonadota bacterium]